MVDYIDCLQPLVAIRMKMDYWDISLAHFHQKLAEDDPLHGVVDVVKHCGVVAKFNGGAIPVRVKIETVITGFVVTRISGFLWIIAVFRRIPQFL